MQERLNNHDSPEIEILNIDFQVKRLIDEHKKNSEIASELRLTRSELSKSIARLIKSGQTESLKNKRRYGGAREKVKRYLDHHNIEFGIDIPVSQQKIAKHVGITRERVRQILLQLKETQKIPPFGLKSRTNNTEGLDKCIRILKNQNLSNKDIAERLRLKNVEVQESISRIRNSKDKEIEKITKQILDLRKNERLGSISIAVKLDVSPSFVGNILEKYFNEDPDLRLRKKKRSKDELEGFRQKVKELRLKGLNKTQIATKLNVSKYNIVNAVHELLIAGEIPKRS